MIFHKLAPLLALGLNLLLLGTALAPDRKSHREKLFACLAGALAWWNLGVFGLRVSDDPATALIWEQLLHIGVIPLPVCSTTTCSCSWACPRARAPSGRATSCAGAFSP